MPPAWLGPISSHPAVRQLADTIARAKPNATVTARNSVGSSTTIVTAALNQLTSRPILLVTAHLDEADEAVDELTSHEISAARFAAVEYSPGESNISLDLVAERLALISRIEAGDVPNIVVAPIPALMQAVPAHSKLGTILRVIEPGTKLDPKGLSSWLTDAGYMRVETIESPGEFAIRGGIIDVFPPAAAVPARIDLFGDEVESICEIDLDSMGSDRKLNRLELVGGSNLPLPSGEDRGASVSNEPSALLTEFLPLETVIVLAEFLEIAEQGRGYYERVSDAKGIVSINDVFKSLTTHGFCILQINHLGSDCDAIALPIEPIPTFSDNAAEAVAELAALARTHDATVLCQNEGECQRMGELLIELAPETKISIESRYLHRGFIFADDSAERPAGFGPMDRPLALIPYHELLHRFQTRRRIRRLARSSKTLESFIDLQVGDYVVHREHGIARFIGLKTMEDTKGTPEEYLTLEFAAGAKLHVPVSKIDYVQRYIGAFTGAPELSTLGGKKWKRQKEQVRDAVRDFAAEMLRIQAAREAMPGIRYPADTAWQMEFEAEFPYEETEDQLAAIAAIKRDMSDRKPMDRLVCGDVGFGKTEVAMRAAFKAAEYGKQVAVLVPTTVLCEQHERTFRERFADYPFRVESVSRFRSKGDQTQILKALQAGQVDVIIGTHRLLSKDVRFADLGLVIIDEEQRFGVDHKQKLLQFRATADVLTLSATPIPRTLHMSLLGLRDISSLSTPPLDRRAIVTDVLTYDSKRIEQAIARELAREGQVFFVHNRVHNIEAIAHEVQRLAPDARVIVGHGQMPMRQLESVMLKFIRGQADVLVCTTIIESGIDIPRANTMFINDADMFGLSELHQLRGRVGRFKHRAYCYMMVSPDKVLSEVAMKRLRAIENFSMLGAGFKIALRDLEIRGAGSLLGQEQSGHIAAVGYEMYCQLLEQEVAALKNDRRVSAIDTTIDIGMTGGLPRGYIPSDVRRMDAYRRISVADDFNTLEKTRRDLVSAYGDLPRAAKTLFDLAEIRIAAASLDIVTMTRHENDIIFRTRKPQLLEEHMSGAKGSLRLVGQPDSEGITEIYYRPPLRYFDSGSLLNVLRQRLRGRAAVAV